jgi:hypothetical protein
VDRFRIILLFALLLLLRGSALADEWYVSYGKGLEAFKKQQWKEAVSLLTDAIGEKSESRARAKTYGMQFIDYFPYVYRGVAYFKLNDREKAKTDLEKAEEEAVVGDARDDENAARLLREYLDLVRRKSVPAAPQPDAGYAEGLRLYNRKEYAAATEKLKAVPPSAREYSDAQKYADLAQREVRNAEAAGAAKDLKGRTDKAFAAGVQYFNGGALDNAESEFTTVVSLDGSRADARRYLARIKTRREELAAASRRQPTQTEPPAPQGTSTTTPGSSLLQEAVTLFSQGKISRARAMFEELRRTEPGNADAARYLQSIEETTRRTQQGITAFFEGEYQAAIEKLGESAKTETDNAHLYAFLACSYAARYLLAGEEDGSLRDNAREAYSKVKSVDASYSLDKKFVSPRILTMLGAP